MGHHCAAGDDLSDKRGFSGKTIAPFVTHGGSRLGRAVEDIKKLCPKATVLPGLAVYGESVADAQEITAAWLRRNGLAR